MVPRRYKDVNVSPRSSWTNRPLTTCTPQDPHTRSSVTVHWPAMNDCMSKGDTVGHQFCLDLTKQIEAEHLAEVDQGYCAIAYNLLVCVHGVVIEGRTAYKRSGANGTTSANETSGSVNVLVGMNETPSMKMLHATRAAAWMLTVNAVPSRALLPHSHWVATQCPGPDLTEWIKVGARDPYARVYARIGRLTSRIAHLRKRRRALHELVK